jgi:uncharacterized protein (TIGR02118 family)
LLVINPRRQGHVIRIVALHRSPPDPEEYEAYYRETHMPLVERVPGVHKVRIGKVVGTPTGEEPGYWLMSEVYFEGASALETAMRSPEMRVAMDDVPNFAVDGQVTIMYCDTEDIVVDGSPAPSG